MKIDQPKSTLEFGVPDGEYLVVVRECNFTEYEGQATNTLRISFQIAEGDYEGQVASAFCPLDKTFGRIMLAKIIGYSGVAENLEKKHKISPDLEPEAWVKYLDPSDPKANKLIYDAMTQLPGKYLVAEFRTREYKDKSGDMRTFQRLASVGFASNKAPSSPAAVAEGETDSW